MKFLHRKRRPQPSVIIVSLIDILMVLLIFLSVTTTFKQQPAIKLSLPESKQPREGSKEANLIVTIAKDEPHFYLGPVAVTFDKLHSELRAAAAKNPDLVLSIRADSEAPWGRIVQMMDTVKELNIGPVNFFTQEGLSAPE